MIIGVISDTHDKLATINSAMEFFAEQGVERVIHCGDWKSVETARYLAEKAATLDLPVTGVLGNNDVDVAGFMEFAAIAPGDLTLQEGVVELLIDTKRIAIYHGHHNPTLRRVRENPAYDILLLGHTHKPKIEDESGRLILNPGSTAFSIPRSKGWRPTVAIVDTVTIKAELRSIDI